MPSRRVELLAKVVNHLWDEARMDELVPRAQAHIITGLMARYIKTHTTNPAEIQNLATVIGLMLQAFDPESSEA